MKNLISILLVLLLAPHELMAAEMLYRQSFEDPVVTSPGIQWETSGYPITQAQISDDLLNTQLDNPLNGSKSIRGNFNKSAIDPISKIAGNPFVQFKINFDEIPTLKEWYLTTPRIYVSWWFKLDRCHWKGTAFDNPDPLLVSGKFAYLRMNEDPATSYYFTMEGGAEGKGTFSVNDATWMKIWENLYKRGAIYLQNNTPFGSDGNWHQLSFLIDKHSDGQKYLMWWIDGKLMRADRFDLEGKHVISNDFILDSIQFWHTKADAVDKTEGACNGWQIDDFQVWDDAPLKPMPPSIVK